MNKILIIGAGQLGSRHLQAIKSTDLAAEVTVFDTSQLALNTALDRWNGAVGDGKNHKVTIVDQLDLIPKSVDVAIIATSSGPRQMLIQQLLKECKVKYLILEKILFQKIDDLEIIGSILREQHVSTWVNCPRRIYPYYSELKEILDGEKFNLTVSGANWGLMCNVIHYLDFIAWLTGCSDFKLDLSLMDAELIPSKRRGYYEMTGTMIAKFADGSLGSFISHDKGVLSPLVLLGSDNNRLLIDETKGICFQIENGLQSCRKTRFRVPYQSELTGKIIETLLETGECGLTSYEESAKLHRQLMEPVIAYLTKNQLIDKEIFPFT